MRDFKHDRTPLFAAGGTLSRNADDGVLKAVYGDVRILANLGAVPRTLDGFNLPPYGFRTDAPGMTAGRTPGGVGYVTETANGKTDLWIYAQPETAVSVPVPLSGRVTLAFDGEETFGAQRVTLGLLPMTLPQRGRIKRFTPPAALAPLAPRDWPEAKPSIGIIDLGPGLSPSPTSIMPAAWRAAFETSALAKQFAIPVKTLSTYAEITAALAAGPQTCFTIINPYGELFPSAGSGRWRETLDAIRAYVNNGGSWWETAAYSFYRSAFREGNAWKCERCGPAGADYLRFPVGDGAVDALAEPLHVTAIGKTWLGDAVAAKVAQNVSVVNRGTPSTDAIPATLLVAGQENGFIGGYRLDGWGYIWRIGGYNPNPEIAISVAVAATLHQYTHPPEPLSPSGVRYLYHATLTPVPF